MNHTSAYAEALNEAFRKFCNTISSELKQSMNGRAERGLQIALAGSVTECGSPAQPQYLVNSSDPSHPPYFVDLNARSCTCPDHWKGHYCKHRVAAQIIKISGLHLPKAKLPASQPEPASAAKAASQAIIWACLRQNGKVIGVEVLGIENELVRVQALPMVKESGKLEPQFPFPEGQCSLLVPVSDLEHIRVYQDA